MHRTVLSAPEYTGQVIGRLNDVRDNNPQYVDDLVAGLELVPIAVGQNPAVWLENLIRLGLLDGHNKWPVYLDFMYYVM